jgi:putative SOS response-associated peptidase YedK
VLADGFYEWKRSFTHKVPYRITLQTGEPFAFAGIWSAVRMADGIAPPRFAIITTRANSLVNDIHHRMPVILPEGDEEDWLNPQLPLDDAQAMLVPFPAERMTAYPVSTKINSPAYNAPDAVQPVTPRQA